MHKIFFVFAILSVISFNYSHAQNTAALQKAVTDLSKEASMKHASLSVCVYNLQSKSQVYAYNSQQSMTPASVTKLFTTAAGFEKLGSDFRFKTTLAYSGTLEKNGTLHGDIYIIGGGDPVLGSYRYRQTTPDSVFAEWTKAVASAGIKAVNGRVLYDASIFDGQQLHDSWQWGDIGNYYGSGICGLNFHENMFFIYFTPGARLGFPASVSRLEPTGLALRVVNNVTTGAAKSGDNVIVYGDPSSTIRTCYGTMPIDDRNFSVRASLPKPPQACADLFTLYLRRNKISVSGAASEAIQRPSNLVNILEYTSPTYYIIAQYTNITSNNTYAEAIHRYLGYLISGKGNSENGAMAVADYIKRLKVESSGVKLEDGCGLSRNNRMTTDFICRFLAEVKRADYFEDFSKSMALAGENGTVKNMLMDLPSGTKVRVKTGSMTGVRAYAGYVVKPSGEKYSFAIIANDYECAGPQMRAKLEKIISKIAALE
jgi:D-alanyl-D-alanine carboxypeptidase/D-alanyl-D-alanine-endopeptidase (penicillin-binding protein 4)